MHVDQAGLARGVSERVTGFSQRRWSSSAGPAPTSGSDVDMFVNFKGIVGPQSRAEFVRLPLRRDQPTIYAPGDDHVVVRWQVPRYDIANEQPG